MCGLTRPELGALTIPEVESMVEAAYWQEARTRKFLVQCVVHLLSPYLEKGASVPWIVEGMLGGDPESRILEARRRRLNALEAGTGSWPR